MTDGFRLNLLFELARIEISGITCPIFSDRIHEGRVKLWVLRVALPFRATVYTHR
jgi:hypothetical protein